MTEAHQAGVKAGWTSALKTAAIALGALAVLAVFVWQAIVAHGAPDVGGKDLSHAGLVMRCGVLVFREGLEAILVLSAVTAGVARAQRRDFTRAVPLGGVAAFLASLATWFIVVAVISQVNAPALDVQAGTGLLAIVVLLVVMNWFFHKVYWTGWITNLNEQRQKVMQAANSTTARTFLGLVLVGFTAVYREGFEIVLFLQDLRLKAGNGVILQGTAIGLGLTLIVAALTFLGHRKLPYKKMLVLTGYMLGLVLLVMVGEEAQEMQLAGWLHTTRLPLPIPDWMGMWFAVFPTVQTLAAQAIAASLVLGSYLWVSYAHLWRSRRRLGATR